MTVHRHGFYYFTPSQENNIFNSILIYNNRKKFTCQQPVRWDTTGSVWMCMVQCRRCSHCNCHFGMQQVEGNSRSVSLPCAFQMAFNSTWLGKGLARFMLCIAYMSTLVAKEDVKTCLDTSRVGRAPWVFMKVRETHNHPGYCSPLCRNVMGPYSDPFDGWFDDQYQH